MPNGADKNFIRLCATIDGFRIRYKAWPAAVRLRAGVIGDLRDHVLGPEAFAKVEAKVRLIPGDALMIAEDGTGHSYNYEENGPPDQDPDLCARDWLGVEALEEVRYDRAMEAAIHLAVKFKYLGDRTVINTLLRTYAYNCLKRRATEMPVEESSKMDVSEAHDLADVFLGKNKAYRPMLPWNSAGHIDRWLNDNLKVEGDTPQEVVARAIVTFLLQMYKITNECAENPVPGQWEKEVDAVSKNFSKLFMGIWPFAQAEKKSQTDDSSVTASPDAEYGLAEALGDAAPENYLGDFQVVERLLRDFALFAIKNWRAGESGRERVSSEERGLVQIFLGADDEYTAVAGWNEPGNIDVFLFKKFPFDDSTPEARVECALNELLEEATDLLAMHSLGKPLDELSAKLQASIRRYTGLFLGMEPSSATQIG